MAEFFLRPATEADEPEIKALIRQVRINPLGLDWRRFTVTANGPVRGEDKEMDKMIACAQGETVYATFKNPRIYAA